MKIAVSTTCSDGYVIYLDHFIKSILKFNPDFDYDFLIYCDCQLSLENRDLLKKLYNKFIFIDVNPQSYKNKDKESIKFYSIECFRQVEYDRIIYWGSDEICLQKLDEIFEVAKDINGIAMPIEHRRGDDLPYNNGGMIIGKEYINQKTYSDLLGYSTKSNPSHLRDQKLYNMFFKGRIKKIHSKYNALVSELDFTKWEEIFILHYIYKPTLHVGMKELENQVKGHDLLKLWNSYD